MSVSLRALRACVQVARSKGIAPAARALNVTPSAVSHLLADLEGQVGVPLFVDRRRVAFNETGLRLVERLAPAFAEIDAAVREALTQRPEIRLSTVSTFAVLWLIPRLPSLQALLPGVNLLVSTDMRPVDLAREPFDCAIRWGKGGWPQVDATLLFRERLGIVASPHLLEAADGAALWRLPRLQARSRPDDWRRFLPPSLLAGHAAHQVATFETRALMLQAAVAGLGLAVMDLDLASQTLDAGHVRLAQDRIVEAEEGYFFVTRSGAAGKAQIATVRDWLVREAKCRGA